MNNIKFFSVFFLFLVLGVSSCDHDTETFDGPSLVDRFGPFNVLSNLTVSQPTVDFAAGETVFFSAAFNINVNWMLEITGMESGSIKRIEGFSNELNASNATWNGGTTVLPLFRAEEEVNVLLTVEGQPEVMETVTVETLSARVFEGLLVTDFEEDLGTDLFFGNFESEFNAQTGRQTDFPAEGDFYYRLDGSDVNLPNFFVGLVDIKSEVTGSGTLQFPTTVPDDLFFNVFMFSDGCPHGLAIIEFFIDGNDSGTYELDLDTQTFRIPADTDLSTFDGWQHMFYPMSETGITQEQLETVVAMRVLLISNMNTQPSPTLPVNFGIDFMIFTEGGPLEL